MSGWGQTSVPIRSATVLPPTCSMVAPTSKPCSSFWGTRVSPPPKSIRTSASSASKRRCRRHIRDRLASGRVLGFHRGRLNAEYRGSERAAQDRPNDVDPNVFPTALEVDGFAGSCANADGRIERPTRNPAAAGGGHNDCESDRQSVETVAF